jgi:hypothetical protein
MALVGGEWSASRPGRFTPGKKHPVSIVQEVGWTPVPVLTTWRSKNSWPYQYSNSVLSVVQPVASRYIDYAIRHLFRFLDTGLEITNSEPSMRKFPPNLICSYFLRRRIKTLQSSDSRIIIVTSYFRSHELCFLTSVGSHVWSDVHSIPTKEAPIREIPNISAPRVFTRRRRRSAVNYLLSIRVKQGIAWDRGGGGAWKLTTYLQQRRIPWR